MSNRRAVVVLVAVFAALVAAALAHVWLRMGVYRMGYAITDETRSRHELEDQNRKLRLEISLLRNPERIERLAREKLGMERPDPEKIRVIRPGDVQADLGAERVGDAVAAAGERHAR